MSLIDRIGGFFKNRASRTASLMAGGATAAYGLGLATPDMITFAQTAFEAVLAHAPGADTATQAAAFFDGAMRYVATVGSGFADWADSAGIEVGRHIRDTLVEMHNWLGDGVESARKLFHETISQSREFIESAKRFAAENAPKDVFDAGKMIIAGLGAASGAWEGLKLLKAAYGKVFGRAAVGAPEEAKSAEAKNIQINIAINGGLVAEDALDKVQEAISHEAPVLSPDTVEATRRAIQAAAVRAASDKAMAVAANDNLFDPQPPMPPAANDDAYDPDFDPELRGLASYPAASDTRTRSPIETVRRSLDELDGGPIRPEDLSSLSGQLRWLVRRDLPRSMDRDQHAPAIASIEGGIVLRVIPKDGSGILDHRHPEDIRKDGDIGPCM